jgi:hypothetical protein
MTQKLDEMEFTNRVAELTGKREFWKAFLLAQLSMETVTRDRKNDHFKSKYATLESVLDVVVPALNKCGIALMQYPTHLCDMGSVRICTKLVHSDTGYVHEFVSEIPVKDITDPQKLGSAITYGKRYALLAACGLGTEDDDGNAASKPKDKTPEEKLRDKCSASKDNAVKLKECLVEAEVLNMPSVFMEKLAARIKELESK